MTQIKTINSEADIREDVVENFKVYRVIPQTACYIGDGTDRYYNPKRTNMSARYSGSNYNYPKIAQMLNAALTTKKGGRIVVISLGCGSCEIDKAVLERLHKMGHDFSFFGVDSSMSMLYKAGEVLEDASFETDLICANFGTSKFKKGLGRIVGQYDVAIYLFSGNTLGNLNQSYIGDVLKNILRKGDYLLLDVAGFETVSSVVQAKMFKRYKGYLNNPADAEFYLGPLKELGVPESNGKLTLKVTEDDETQAQVFTFGFKVNTLTEFKLEEEEIGLSPNEHVVLHHVLIYDLDELTNFLETKRFKVKDRLIGEFMNQLLLEKQ